MTRVLSQLLGAEEPKFSQSIHQLERAGGLPATDIRLTTDIAQRLRTKITELGLDPVDTTGPELFRALEERLKRDELVARKALGLHEDATPDEVISRVHQFLEKDENLGSSFTLRANVAKRLLRKKLPRHAMKLLGYRSFDSMLKHESVPRLFAAIAITESASWQRSLHEQYARLKPSDFETRKLTISHPLTSRWQQVSQEHVAAARQNILSFPELGAIVLLPIAEAVEGLAITTILLVAEELNNIRARSSYIKLQQVRPDFGKLLGASLKSEPYTAARLADQAVPWRVIHRYYARFVEAYHPEVFEPHVQPEDLSWNSGEEILARLDPSLSFWRGTENVGLLHEGKIVSCNALDVSLGVCNKLPFTERIVHFVRDKMWHELMMGYLHQDNLESAVHQQLAAELAEPNGQPLAAEIEAEAV